MATVNFLPGPVTVAREVRAAFRRAPVSHRSAAFQAVRDDTAAALRKLTRAKHAALMTGSGTLANDVVAQQIRRLRGPGLILANGEFGERLIGQAGRCGLRFETERIPWGQVFDLAAVFKKLSGKGWVWLTACETSTGMINPFRDIMRFCAAEGIKVCLDAISAIGNMPVDCSKAYLATATSGKGLGAYAGLAMVFYNHEAAPDPSTPTYIDLGTYHRAADVPFTMPSSLLCALCAALRATDFKEKFARLRQQAAVIRNGLKGQGLRTPITQRQSDFMWTLEAPDGITSRGLGDRLHAMGIITHYRNRYLLANNWLQISLMGSLSLRDVTRLMKGLGIVNYALTQG
ncbi:MAG: aminotransferase class V-fold PLP-dependent enzyme [Kiritimatiellaeota bacterium]|nr:aminotransferase class V-fold PLP-dependent enzyme [Kiritimatiellota bacterium]